jgi:hypothetical protein
MEVIYSYKYYPDLTFKGYRNHVLYILIFESSYVFRSKPVVGSLENLDCCFLSQKSLK